MKPNTEEFLLFLLWSAEHLMRPNVRNWTDSFETWTWRNGWQKSLTRLEARHLVERVSASPTDRVYRLSEAGRLHALGGRDPVEQWARPWDGLWRLVIFDIPRARNTLRQQVRRYLRGRHFGCLQGSLWVTPAPLEPERQVLRGAQIEVTSLILMEGRPCTGESDAQIVAGAWNWPQIHAGYTHHLKLLEARPHQTAPDRTTGQALLDWAAVERLAWVKLMERDPLLPERLLPAGYLGQQVWQRRVEALAAAQHELSTFPAAA